MKNLTIIFNDKSPLYLQIYEAISQKINQGIILSDEKLPSKRKLAEFLDVSINTIVSAYNLLLDEGYIYAKEKKGYFVSSIEKITISEPKIFIDEKKEVQNDFDLTTQNTHNIDFSYSSFNKTIRETIAEKNFLQKTPLEGLVSLRKAIASHLLLNRGLTVNYQQIIIGSGLEMLSLLFPIFEAKSYAIENPGYHKLATLLNNAKLEVEFVSLDNNGVTIPKKSTILYTTPYNQFPTGIRMTINRKNELINWAKKNHAYIIEDDFDAEFRISGSPTTVLFSLAPENVIFFSTFSTTLFSGLRVAYMVLPDELLKKYRTFYYGYSNTVSSLDQNILCSYLSSGAYAKHINQLKNKYLKKRQLIINNLKDNKYLSIDTKRNYLSIILKLDNKFKEEDLLQKFKEEKIKINFISFYDHYQNKTNELILGYTNISNSDLLIALDKLKEVLEK